MEKYLRLVAGALFIAAFAVLALVANNNDDRRVHVLPHLGQTYYEIHVYSAGRSLTSSEVARRYRLPFHGVSPLTPIGLKSIVRERETRAGPENDAFVRVHLRAGAKPEEIWLWPES